MAKDLHSFIKQIESEHPDDLVRISKPVNPADFDVTAVMEHLYRRGRKPAVLFENPTDLHGNPSSIPVLINVFAERERCATALDFPRDQAKLPLSQEFSRREQQSVDPVTISRDEAVTEPSFMAKAREEEEEREAQSATRAPPRERPRPPPADFNSPDASFGEEVVEPERE